MGDASVGQESLLRFNVLHVAVLPLVMALLIVIHFCRRDGGLSCPPEADEAGTPVSVTVRAVQVAKNRVYGLQGFVRGPFSKIGNLPDKTVFSWPNLLIAELFVFVLTLAVILTVSIMWKVPWPAGRRSSAWWIASRASSFR